MKAKPLFSLLIISIILNISCQSTKTYAENSTRENKRNYITHTVEKGETTYSIARQYKMDLQELYKLNPKSKTSIKAGDELMIPLVQKIEYKSHKPQKGETIYSISKQYGLTVDDILQANPNLGNKGLKVGKNIRIPIITYNHNENHPIQTVQVQEYKVQSKETLYGISKKFDVTIEDIMSANPDLKGGLKEGMVIAIPAKGNSQSATSEDNNYTYNDRNANKVSTIKVGVLLPFLDKAENRNQRFIEYYEGFLIAIEDMKKRGYSLELYTFDIGAGGDTKKLKSLLETSDIAALHMIIGGVTSEQISILSDYTEAKDMKYVIPFPSKTESAAHSNAFQVCLSHSDLYPRISERFSQKYQSDNIIFVSDKATDDRSDLVEIMKSDLRKKGVSFKQVQMGSNLESALTSALSSSQTNIIIPSSSTYQALSKVLTSIKILLGENYAYTVNLFGYPEWQTYTQLNNDLIKFNTTIYSSFYVEKNTKTQDFEVKYKNAYGKSMMNTFPKYAMLGYDTGEYFIPAMKEYGVNFENNLKNIRYNPLQSTFHFTKDSDGGYINNGFYFIEYSDLGIERTASN